MPKDYRQIVRTKLAELDLDIDDVKNIEKSIYNKSIVKAHDNCTHGDFNDQNFRNFYRNLFQQVFLNIKQDSYVENTYLREQIDSGELNLKKITNLKPHETCPERWQHIIESNKKQDEFMYSKRREQITDEYFCNRCHKRECIYWEQQTRSVDEPMTTFIRCENCNNKWRKG